MSAKKAKQMRRIATNIIASTSQKDNLTKEDVEHLVGKRHYNGGRSRVPVTNAPHTFRAINNNIKKLFKTGEAERIADKLEQAIIEERKILEKKAEEDYLANG